MIEFLTWFVIGASATWLLIDLYRWTKCRLLHRHGRKFFVEVDQTYDDCPFMLITTHGPFETHAEAEQELQRLTSTECSWSPPLCGSRIAHQYGDSGMLLKIK